MAVVEMIRPLDFSGYNIPGHTQDALRRYIEQRIFPGGFLTAVLSNNLFEAVGQADSDNIKAIPDIVKFIYNRVPADAWGSREKMEAWTRRTLFKTFDKPEKKV